MGEAGSATWRGSGRKSKSQRQTSAAAKAHASSRWMSSSFGPIVSSWPSATSSRMSSALSWDVVIRSSWSHTILGTLAGGKYEVKHTTKAVALWWRSGVWERARCTMSHHVHSYRKPNFARNQSVLCVIWRKTLQLFSNIMKEVRSEKRGCHNCSTHAMCRHPPKAA